MKELDSKIKEKGLTAPRVTPADIENEIRSIHFFTAKHGMDGALKAGEYEGREKPAEGDLSELGLLTFCVIITRNGFTVTGESACASPENFDASLGREIAFNKAKEKLWPLLGYVLKERLRHRG